MCDALAVDTPIWVLGDSAYDILDWHDYLLAAGSCQSTRETVTNTNAFFPSLPSLQSLLKQGGVRATASVEIDLKIVRLGI